MRVIFLSSAYFGYVYTYAYELGDSSDTTRGIPAEITPAPMHTKRASLASRMAARLGWPAGGTSRRSEEPPC
jgi:hypothetical protein